MPFKTISGALKDELAVLEAEAEALVSAHIAWVVENGRHFKTWDERSSLTVDTRRTGDSIVIYWHEVKWKGTLVNKSRKAVLVWIRKPKESFSYTMLKLVGYAKPWEKSKVEETELKAAAIRRKLKAIQRIAAANRIAITEYKTAEKTQE